MNSPRKRIHQPRTPNLTEKARRLRCEATAPEKLLWRAIRARQIRGLKFRCQFVIRPYVVDFYCAEAGLVIEVDGESHAGSGAGDRARDRFLESKGLRVLRVKNDEVLQDLETVVSAILLAAVGP